MIPEGAEGIAHLATRIVTDFVPKAVDVYTAADLGMLSALVTMVGQDYDRAADVLLTDVEEIKAIFTIAAPRFGDDALGQRMTRVLAAEPEGRRIHQLNLHADAAMRVLIDLHARGEAAAAEGADWAPQLDQAIWTFLDSHVARRRYDSAF